MVNSSITAVLGVRVGHAVRVRNLTGTTVLLVDKQAVTAVDARGGWPGTLDTDSVGPGKTFYRKHAIFLTGGDVFGLKCAFGIQRFLLERGVASKIEPGSLPGVVGANIYDLEFGKSLDMVDYEMLGYEACRNATAKPVQQGNFGAGLGATVGKLRGIRDAMKGGVGSSVSSSGGRFRVGALAVVNSVGNVFGSDGTTIAGTRSRTTKGKFVEMEEIGDEFMSGQATGRRSARATTIAVVATDLELSHEETLKVAEMAHDGVARSIRPVHGATDGDTIFCVSTAERRIVRSNPDLITLVGHLAAIQMQKAVVNAILKAKPLGGVPAAGL